jgi:hypothetical protein
MKYRSKEVIQAFQVGFDIIPEWFKKKHMGEIPKTIEKLMMVDKEGNFKMIYKGDYICNDENNKSFVLPEQEFNNKYELIKEKKNENDNRISTRNNIITGDKVTK